MPTALPPPPPAISPVRLRIALIGCSFAAGVSAAAAFLATVLAASAVLNGEWLALLLVGPVAGFGWAGTVGLVELACAARDELAARDEEG